MAGRRHSSNSGLLMGVAGATLMSALFLGLAVLTSVVAAAVVTLPAGFALASVLARFTIRESPHVLSPPVFADRAELRAPRVSTLGDDGAITAA